MAPSAGNEQPWHFIVIKDKALLKKIGETHRYHSMAASAGAAILVCSDTALEKYPGFWVQDLSAATENLLLAAHALGIGAVWTGVYPREDRMAAYRKLLHIPEHIIPFALIPLGYPAEEHGVEDRYNAQRVHRDTWS
jgi:nitroreductase